MTTVRLGSPSCNGLTYRLLLNRDGAFRSNEKRMTTLICGLTLVRHGETSYNRKGILQGQAIDSPLSNIGFKQADAAGLYLKDVKFSNVYVSDMLRARQTAESILKHNCSCSASQINCDSLLKEKSFGIAEGQQVKEVKELAKAAGQSFLDFTPPGGETGEQVKERFKAFWDKLLQQIGQEHWETHGGKSGSSVAPIQAPVEGRAHDGLQDAPVHVLVVTHGAYMREAVKYFMENLNCSIPQVLNKSHMLSLSPNTGLCRFIVSLEKEKDSFRQTQIHCVFMHRADHLQPLGE
ncbi:probable fructose-2,6-bisphosphatase TIGAR A [Boleophthalmus pectinirostris]|uniref:probable fructose-2,6-bisphosphatase TIGAR A n=1 Tax=Boleophthalmus pectinirostris TaxID=150288 RepID=UPI002431F616|nr:probable fructose-2,6-bisphosphatase TIGAR A [Boleophthalmus pectinirostris]